MKPKITILLIDDDEDEYLIFRLALENLELDYQLFTVQNAEEGTGIIKSSTPDFIFVDMNMPAVNGLECLEKFKQLSLSSRVSVIMYSTHMTQNLCDKAMKLGASMCVKKPNTINELKLILQKIFIDKVPPADYLFYA